MKSELAKYLEEPTGFSQCPLNELEPAVMAPNLKHLFFAIYETNAHAAIAPTEIPTAAPVVSPLAPFAGEGGGGATIRMVTLPESTTAPNSDRTVAAKD